MKVRKTPNPVARKFILDKEVNLGEPIRYYNKSETKNNLLAHELFSIAQINYQFYGKNFVTIGLESADLWDKLEPEVLNVLSQKLEEHCPLFSQKTSHLKGPEELKEVELIVDEHIRPFLKADGGDIKCLSYRNNTLMIEFLGACGSCPSALTGTLDAITSVLKEKFNPNIRVEIV